MTEPAPRPLDSPENPHAGQGSAVMLDIGGDIGALVVTMPAEMAGLEVEIAPEGEAPVVHDDHAHDDDTGHGHGHGHGHRLHVAVVRRPVQDGELPSLVFPELVEGGYELFAKGSDEVRLTVQVRGGEVTSADWPS